VAHLLKQAKANNEGQPKGGKKMLELKKVAHFYNKEVLILRAV